MSYIYLAFVMSPVKRHPQPANEKSSISIIRRRGVEDDVHRRNHMSRIPIQPPSVIQSINQSTTSFLPPFLKTTPKKIKLTHHN